MKRKTTKRLNSLSKRVFDFCKESLEGRIKELEMTGVEKCIQDITEAILKNKTTCRMVFYDRLYDVKLRTRTEYTEIM
jgi:hypothetical protein